MCPHTLLKFITRLSTTAWATIYLAYRRMTIKISRGTLFSTFVLQPQPTYSMVDCSDACPALLSNAGCKVHKSAN